MEQFISLRGILITVLMITGFAAILIRPKVGIALILMVTLLRDGFLYIWFQPIYDLHLPQILIYLTLIAWLLHLKEYPLRLNKDILFAGGFFLVICSTRFFAGTPIWDHPVVNENLRVVTVFFLIIQLMRTNKDIRAILWVLVGIYLFLELRAYYFYKTDYMEIALPNYRYVNRNSFANHLALMLPVAYMLGNNSKNKLFRGFGLFTALWCGIGVILTYSRSGFLGLAAGIAGIMLLQKRKTKLIITLVILALLILPRLSEKYTGRIETIEAYEEDASAMGRVATNYAALNMFKENPVLGVGAGNFNDVFLSHTPPEYLKWVEEGKSVHNIMLQVASETGLLGLAFFIPLVLFGFKNSFIKIPQSDPDPSGTLNIAQMLRLALFVTVLTAQFGQGGYAGSIYLLLPLLSVLRQNISEQLQPQKIKRR